MATTLTVAPFPYTAAVLRSNRCPNPSVETSTSGWNASFGTGGAGSSSAQAVADAPAGARVFRSTWSAPSTAVNGGVFYDKVQALTPGSTYTFSMWGRVTGQQQRLSLAVEWYDDTNTMVPGGGAGPTAAPASGTWRRWSHTLTAPAGATRARVLLWATQPGATWSAGVTLDADALLVESTSELRDYFDGSTRDYTLSPGVGYQWDGTAHASVSRLIRQDPTAEAQQVTVDLITRWEDWVEDTSVWHQVVGSDRFLPSVAPWTPRFVRFEVWCATAADAQGVREVLTAQPQIATMLRSDEHPAIEMYVIATRVGMTAERAGRWIVPVEGREWARP